MEGTRGGEDQDRERLIRSFRDGNPEALAEAAREAGVDPEELVALVERIVERGGPPYRREHFLQLIMGPDWEEPISCAP